MEALGSLEQLDQQITAAAVEYLINLVWSLCCWVTQPVCWIRSTIPSREVVRVQHEMV